MTLSGHPLDIAERANEFVRELLRLDRNLVALGTSALDVYLLGTAEPKWKAHIDEATDVAGFLEINGGLFVCIKSLATLRCMS